MSQLTAAAKSVGAMYTHGNKLNAIAFQNGCSDTCKLGTTS